MPISPFRNFDYLSIDELILEGVNMVYDRNHYMTDGGEYWGRYHYGKRRVYIYPNIKEKKNEDITIVHEWLHAYEIEILGLPPFTFKDDKIDWWAHFHLRRDQGLADYIRRFFPDFRVK